MTNRSLAALDAQIMSAFLATGWADSATLNGTPCSVYIDRDVQTIGAEGEVIGPNDTATFLRSQVTPQRASVLALGSEMRTLIKNISEDESESVWILG